MQGRAQRLEKSLRQKDEEIARLSAALGSLTAKQDACVPQSTQAPPAACVPDQAQSDERYQRLQGLAATHNLRSTSLNGAFFDPTPSASMRVWQAARSTSACQGFIVGLRPSASSSAQVCMSPSVLCHCSVSCKGDMGAYTPAHLSA